jgi:hypothetical protein
MFFIYLSTIFEISTNNKKNSINGKNNLINSSFKK